MNNVIKGYENKTISNLKDNIEMSVIDGKLTVLNLVTFDLVEEGKETSGFFESINSKDEIIECCIPIQYKDGVIISYHYDWLKDDKNKFNLDKYPSEMQPAINKSINKSKGILKDTKKKVISGPDILDISFFSKNMEIVEKAYTSLMNDIKKYKQAGMSDNIEEFMDRYMFKKHILVQGEKGAGKTYAVHKKLEEEGISYIEIDGHEGIESIDLLGYPIKDLSGNFVWLDGTLTEAFRKAQTERVVLFIDELLRIPKKEQNIFVGSLTPMSDSTYTLRTGRLVDTVDGIGKTEYIKVPISNLWVVGTTNVGAGYAIEEIDEAFADRFRILNKMTTETELEAIILSQITSKGLKEDLVPNFLSFYKEMRDLVDGGELEKRINTRHICEIIQLTENESTIKDYAFDLLPQWVTQDTDGSLNKAEIDIISKIIRKHF